MNLHALWLEYQSQLIWLALVLIIMFYYITIQHWIKLELRDFLSSTQNTAYSYIPPMTRTKDTYLVKNTYPLKKKTDNYNWILAKKLEKRK